MSILRVTLVQTPSLNLDSVLKTIGDSESDVIVFPEETLRTETLDEIDKIRNAVGHKHVFLGVIYLYRNRTYNFGYYISANKVERYQKVHVHWTEAHVPGKTLRVIKMPFGRVGILICFDTAFQESARVLALKGAEMIMVLHAIPQTFSIEHVLLRSQAMALNNQLFVVQCCKAGPGFSGESVIINPRGRVIIKLDSKPQISTFSIDLDEVKEWRAEEKIFPFRKPRIYQIITKEKTFQKPFFPSGSVS